MIGAVACDSRNQSAAEDGVRVSSEVEVALARMNVVPGMDPAALEASIRSTWANLGGRKTQELLDVVFDDSPMSGRAAGVLGTCNGADSAALAYDRLAKADAGAKFKPSVVGWLIFTGSDSIAVAVGRGRALIASADDATALVGHTLLSFTLFQTTSPYPQTIIDRKTLVVDRDFWRKILDRMPESWTPEDVLVKAWESRIDSRKASGGEIPRNAGGLMQGRLFAFMFHRGHPDHLSVWQAGTEKKLREYVRRIGPVSFQDFKMAFNILQLVE